MFCALTTSPTGAQPLPTCIITPFVNVTGSSAVTATLTISSTGSTTSALAVPKANGMRWLGVNGVVTLAGLLLLGFPARGRRRRILLGLVLMFAVAGGFSACGGSGGGSGGGGTNSGTPAGNYTFTVTCTAQGVSESGTVVVIIQ